MIAETQIQYPINNILSNRDRQVIIELEKRRYKLEEYKVICTKCNHTFRPRSLSSKCPVCKNKLKLDQRLDIDKHLKEHTCKKCGHQWIQRTNSILPSRICPSCKSSTWQRPRGPKSSLPYYKTYGVRYRYPIGKDGAQQISIIYYQAQYVKLE